MRLGFPLGIWTQGEGERKVNRGCGSIYFLLLSVQESAPTFWLVRLPKYIFILCFMFSKPKSFAPRIFLQLSLHNWPGMCFTRASENRQSQWFRVFTKPGFDHLPVLAHQLQKSVAHTHVSLMQLLGKPSVLHCSSGQKQDRQPTSSQALLILHHSISHTPFCCFVVHILVFIYSFTLSLWKVIWIKLMSWCIFQERFTNR